MGTKAAIGMRCGYVRYLGPDSINQLILIATPEVVCAEGDSDAWVLGSGVSEDDSSRQQQMAGYFDVDVPVVVDAGALAMLQSKTPRRVFVITPHHGEAAKLLSLLGIETTVTEVNENPVKYAELLAIKTGAVVNLKSNESVIAATGFETLRTKSLNTHLATAGTGDLLAGTTGALLARYYKSEGMPKIDVAMQIAKLALEVLSEAASIAAETKGFGASDIASCIPLAVTKIY